MVLLVYSLVFLLFSHTVIVVIMLYAKTITSVMSVPLAIVRIETD